MFDSTQLEHKLSQEQFKEIEASLRDELLEAQRELLERGTHSVMVLINGADGAGKGEVLNRLYEWLDPRYLETLAIDVREDIDLSRPPAWQYWQHMPAKGRISAVLGSWYHLLLRQRALGHLDRDGFVRMLEDIRGYEAMLDAEGVKVLKLWLHISPEEARKRFRKVKQRGTFRRPLVQEWADIPAARDKKKLHEVAREIAQLVSPDSIPWLVVPAEDDRYRDIMIGQELLSLIRRTFETCVENEAPAPKPSQDKPSQDKPSQEKATTDTLSVASRTLPRPSILSTVDLSRSLGRDEYQRELKHLQRRIFELTSSNAFQKRGLVCVFEGNDAAGKGGCIRRIRQSLDPREFSVIATAAPNEEERARPYLWRFWRHIPVKGQTVIFDRSWYGRVLVERVEGFCSEADWMRAYGEINSFERQLAKYGYVMAKFWLSISPEEQLRRFEERAETSYKRFKITDEDWRNREKWGLYENAVTEMVDRTSTSVAPWTLVPAEDKKYARIAVLRTVVDRLESAL